MMDRVKARCWEILAIALLFSPFFLFDVYKDLKFKNTDAAEYLEVQNVFVEDFRVGQEHLPVVKYHRIVHKNFKGTWAAKVVSLGKRKNFSVCNNSNTVDYTPEHAPTGDGVSLTWYMDKDCKLKPDTYILRTTWWIHLPQGDKKIVVESNIFEVRE